MKRTTAGLTNAVNSLWPDNTTGEISGADANSVSIDFTDSFVPAAGPVDGVFTGTLQYNNTGIYEINHQLASQNLFIIMYNKNGELLTDEHYYVSITDDNNVSVTLYAPMGVTETYRYVIFNIYL